MKKLTIIIALSTVQFVYAQDKPKADYLAKHSLAWNGEFKNADAVFTPEILHSQLIMIGEGHGIARSYEVQTDIIKYLKKKIGFKYLLQELGYCDGLLLNDYLHTGDESKLQEFFAIHKGTFYWNQNIREFYRQLYTLNKILPEKQKIVILPVDIEHAYRAGIKQLQGLLADVQLNEIDTKNPNGKEIALAYQKFYRSYITDSAGHKHKLGTRYVEASYLARNINETFNIALSGNGKRRDTVMLENFNYYKNQLHLDDQQMAGMFGTYHIRQVNKADEGHFAGLLKNSGAVKSISAAMLCYSGGYIMMPKGYTAAQIDTAKVLYKRVENTYPYIVESLEDGELLAPYRNKNKGMVFNIAAPGSPFKGSKSFLVADDQFATIDQLYQLVILVNDSPAAEPISGGLD